MKVLREIADPKELVKLIGFYNSYDEKAGTRTTIDKLTRKVYDKYDRIVVYEMFGHSERHYFYPFKNDDSGQTTIYFKDKYKETFYTKDGRKKKETDLETGVITTYTYQSSEYGSVLKSEISSDGTSIRYNKNEQVTFKRLPDRSTVTIKYDDNGNLLNSKSSNGQEEKCVYNKYNLLVSYVNSDGEYIYNKYRGKNLVSSSKLIIEKFEKGKKVSKFYFV
jgi:YD repeat-containing protein